MNFRFFQNPIEASHVLRVDSRGQLESKYLDVPGDDWTPSWINAQKIVDSGAFPEISDPDQVEQPSR